MRAIIIDVPDVPGAHEFLERLMKCGRDYVLEAVEREADTFDALSLQERYEAFIKYQVHTNVMEGEFKKV